MDEREFNRLVDEIMEQGFDEETAGHYAALIGDMPIRGPGGVILVMEGTRVIARLRPLKMFEIKEKS